MIVEGHEVLGSAGAVAAGPPEAACIGARMLRNGGNAADAIAASCIAGCMLEPKRAGIAGYVGCAVVLEPNGSSGRVWSIDANAVAPSAADERMFEVLDLGESGTTDRDPALLQSHFINEDEYSCRVRDRANTFGPRAVAVPGVIACIGTIWERFGSVEWPLIVEPSQALLADGLMLPGPDGVRHRPEMESTLARIAKAGWRDVYDGELGRRIADAVQDAGGVLTRKDMADYEPRVTAPYSSTYRNATLHCPILPNGPLSCLQILNMLECFAPPATDDVAYWHRLAEILKIAWRDRVRYLADPDFVDVPVQRLLSKDYAAERVEHMRQFPDHVDTSESADAGASPGDTFHMSSADAHGLMVSVTLSHGGDFGSGFVVPGTGVVLGHGMCRFDPRPGHANSIAPGKRPLNNTCPMLVRLPERDIAIGLPGGRRIVSVNAQMVQRIVDFDATGFEAITAPRMHLGVQEPVELTNSVDEAVITGLADLGHTVRPMDAIAGPAHCVEVLKADHRIRAGGNSWAAGV